MRGTGRARFWRSLGLAGALASSCQLPFRVLVEEGETRTHRMAASRAEELCRFVETVFDAKVGTTAVFVDVAKGPSPEDGILAGTTAGNVITLYPGEQDLTYALAHELAHVVLGGATSPWRALPIVIQEALAYSIGDGFRGILVIELEGSLPSDFGRHLEYSDERYRRSGRDERIAYKALGMQVVARLGLARLREISLRSLETGITARELLLQALDEVPPGVSDEVLEFDPHFGFATPFVERRKRVRVRVDLTP